MTVLFFHLEVSDYSLPTLAGYPHLRDGLAVQRRTRPRARLTPENEKEAT